MTIHEHTWDTLESLLPRIKYTRDSPRSERFRLVREDEDNYAVLYIFTLNPNSYRPDELRHTRHEFVVPVATYNENTWKRWIFDRLVSIELHETCESFFVDDVRVYPPHHGNGEDPYSVWHLGTEEQASKAPGDD